MMNIHELFIIMNKLVFILIFYLDLDYRHQHLVCFLVAENIFLPSGILDDRGQMPKVWEHKPQGQGYQYFFRETIFFKSQSQFKLTAKILNLCWVSTWHSQARLLHQEIYLFFQYQFWMQVTFSRDYYDYCNRLGQENLKV